MSWLYSQALVEEYSEDISLDGEQCAQSSGTHTQPVFSSHDKTTEFSRRSLSGMTFRLLTESRGKALLTSFRAAFHAKTSQRQEREQESTESDQVCGHIWRELSVKFDRDSSSWRTHRCLWEEVLHESSVTLPRSGMMQDGILSERLTSGRRISGTGSGLLLPTPTASDYGQNKSRGKNAKERPSLATMARKNLWPTPRASDHKGAKTSTNTTKRRLEDGKATLSEAMVEAVGGGKLNPTWVEWLMGWPLGWTDLRRLEMDKFQKWRELHGINSRRQSKRDDERKSESEKTNEDHVTP